MCFMNGLKYNGCKKFIRLLDFRCSLMSNTAINFTIQEFILFIGILTVEVLGSLNVMK